jgi:hypothetical protein
VIETLPTDSPKTIAFKLSGKLHHEDYKTFVPTVESFVATEERVRLFVQLEDFHGEDLHALWDDLKFGLKHYSDFDRIAMVGERKWQKWMVQVSKPFTKAKMRYFDASQIDEAWAWLREGIESQPSA